MGFWTQTITLYNHFYDEDGSAVYYRHTIPGCFVKHTSNRITVGNVHIQSDDTIVRIPSQPNFYPAFDWQTLDPETRSKSITLQTDDLIIFGAVTDEIDEYTAGKRKSDVVDKYKDLGYMNIKSFNLNTFLPTKHYLVKGG